MVAGAKVEVGVQGSTRGVLNEAHRQGHDAIPAGGVQGFATACQEHRTVTSSIQRTVNFAARLVHLAVNKAVSELSKLRRGKTYEMGEIG